MTDTPRPLPVRSLSLETNLGGVSVSVCACGVLLLQDDIAWTHIDNCPAAIADIATQEAQP